MHNIIAIAITAMVGLMFTACPPEGGSGSGKVSTKFNFNNSGVVVPTASIITARNTAVMVAATMDLTFGTYTSFYDTTLGGNVNRKAQITPSSFKLVLSNLSIFGHGTTEGIQSIDLINGGSGVIDFTNSVPVTPGDVFPGTYDIIFMDFSTGATIIGGSDPSDIFIGGFSSSTPAIVRFKWPATAGNFADNIHMIASEATIDGNEIVSVRIGSLLPGSLRYLFYRLENVSNIDYMSDSPFVMNELTLLFAGNSHQLIILENDGTIKLNDLSSSSYPNNATVTSALGLGGLGGNAFVVPFTPITIPEDANLVTFNINWNLDDMIEMYDPDGTGNTDNFIFILKNGWWNGFMITADINYEDIE